MSVDVWCHTTCQNLNYECALTCNLFLCKFLHVKCQKFAKTLSKIHTAHNFLLFWYKHVWKTPSREQLHAADKSTTWCGCTLRSKDVLVCLQLLNNITSKRCIDIFPYTYSSLLFQTKVVNLSNIIPYHNQSFV